MKNIYTNFCNNYIVLIQKEYNIIIDFKINIIFFSEKEYT